MMTNDYLCIIPECYVDTNLVQSIMRVEGTNHQKSCGQVTNQMQNKFKDKFAVGIVDKDKKQSTYSNESIPIASSNELTLCKHPQSHHYLVKINHVMESFILNSAKEVNLDLIKAGFPDSLEGLKKVTKHANAKNNVALTKLFKIVSTSTEMTLLADTLNYLHKKQYCANDDEIKQIFIKHGFEQ